jgi:acetyl esterase/lipase
MQYGCDHYAPDPGIRRHRRVAPLNATLDELRGLPPTPIRTAANDVLRDEGEAHTRKLDQAGVDATCVRYNGAIHDPGQLNASRRSWYRGRTESSGSRPGHLNEHCPMSTGQPDREVRPNGKQRIQTACDLLRRPTRAIIEARSRPRHPSGHRDSVHTETKKPKTAHAPRGTPAVSRASGVFPPIRDAAPLVSAP